MFADLDGRAAIWSLELSVYIRLHFRMKQFQLSILSSANVKEKRNIYCLMSLKIKYYLTKMRQYTNRPKCRVSLGRETLLLLTLCHHVTYTKPVEQRGERVQTMYKCTPTMIAAIINGKRKWNVTNPFRIELSTANPPHTTQALVPFLNN